MPSSIGNFDFSTEMLAGAALSAHFGLTSSYIGAALLLYSGFCNNHPLVAGFATSGDPTTDKRHRPRRRKHFVGIARFAKLLCIDGPPVKGKDLNGKDKALGDSEAVLADKSGDGNVALLLIDGGPMGLGELP